ncbi:ABC transporter permease [Cohnella sp. LGH]|uniref:ABC-type nitrate/sulfonate/bicarbonate transport system permease component n=1 Tax=Cohnella phaseoli TaxID=456490 RepID=A0A3D9KIR0_9BACL|nr:MULTISPECIES: ABC transporter permease [Cohnella]QTH45965.1 ABC transporter permease [Cohnella sp. LGH]RED86325.1 ABC-type nitrate/sulfonate/bicarbonate transport system permease component [Cohnella phaseoli]
MGNKRFRAIALPVGTIVVFLAVWQAVCMALDIKVYTLPAPSDIALNMYEDAATLWVHVQATFGLSLVGLVLGTAVGIAVAVLLHIVPPFKTALSPLLVLSQNVPLIALGPLLIIWLGFGTTPKLILLILVCFFPVALSILVGLGQAEPHLREYLGMIGASRWERLKRLEFPASLTYLFSGLRIAATYVVSSAIVAEWLGAGANTGIGFYLKLKFSGFQQAAVFSSIVCIVVMSLLFFYLVVLAERLVIRWKPRPEPEWKEASP